MKVLINMKVTLSNPVRSASPLYETHPGKRFYEPCNQVQSLVQRAKMSRRTAAGSLCPSCLGTLREASSPAVVIGIVAWRLLWLFNAPSARLRQPGVLLAHIILHQCRRVIQGPMPVLHPTEQQLATSCFGSLAAIPPAPSPARPSLAAPASFLSTSSRTKPAAQLSHQAPALTGATQQ